MAKKQSADQIVLKQITSDLRSETYPHLKKDEHFERFAADLILKDQSLSFEEVEKGIVGSGGDGGVDSVYQFVQGVLTDEDASPPQIPKGGILDLHVIQSKTSNSMGTVPFKHFQDTFEDIFDLQSDLDDHAKTYNAAIISKAEKFREFYLKLASKSPEIHITFHYASYGVAVHPDVQKRADKLEKRVKEIYSSANVKVKFFTAKRLVEEFNRVPSTTRILKCERKLEAEDGSFVSLAKLDDYYKFISDNDQILSEIFDANIRDYQGNVAVNKEIRSTLENKDSDDFWFLNNGVTIISPSASGGGNTITIEDPQIVNGLQTSTEIFNYFSEKDEVADDRMILVRMILEDDESARDRIIKATNSQSNIPAASLRGSDSIHRLIEQYFKSHNYYYDRKKNKYKNQGKPSDRIFSISFLAQAVMSALLDRPDTARARPSTLLRSDDDYSRVFSEIRSPEVYLNAALLARRIGELLKVEFAGSGARKTINNIRWYALYKYIKDQAKDVSKEEFLESLVVPNIAKAKILESITAVNKVYEKFGASDQLAKSAVMIKHL